MAELLLCDNTCSAIRLLHTGASCCCCWSYVFCNSGFFVLYCVIMTTCQWWKIKRELCKTWGGIVGEWQRPVLPVLSAPGRGLFFSCVFSFTRHALVVQLAVCYSASKSHAPPCFSRSSPLPLVVIVFFLHFLETLVLSLCQNLQSLPANWCWTRKCFCLWVTRQEVSGWKVWNFFPPPTTSHESDCLIGQIYCKSRGSQVFGTFILRFSPKKLNMRHQICVWKKVKLCIYRYPYMYQLLVSAGILVIKLLCAVSCSHVHAGTGSPFHIIIRSTMLICGSCSRQCYSHRSVIFSYKPHHSKAFRTRKGILHPSLNMCSCIQSVSKRSVQFYQDRTMI